MPRPRVAIEPFREQIFNWLQERDTQDDILKKLKDQGLEISKRTLQKELQRWQFKAASRNQDSEELREQIAFHFRELRSTEEETFTVLRGQGFNISKTGLRRIRLQMGLSKKISVEEQEAYDQHTRALLEEEYDQGTIEPLSMKNLYSYMRLRYGVVGRNRMRLLAKEINPEGFLRRGHHKVREEAKETTDEAPPENQQNRHEEEGLYSRLDQLLSTQGKDN